MRPVGSLWVLLFLWALPVDGQTVTEADEDLRSGNYEDAERTFRRALRDDPSSLSARRDLIEVLATTGEYDDARSVALEAPEPVGIANSLGEVLVLSGKLDEADAAFRRAIDGNAPDALTAEANLAELLFNRGELDEAMRRFDRFIDVYNAADGRLRAAELVVVGRAMSYLGRRTPVLFHDALKAYDEAAVTGRGSIEVDGRMVDVPVIADAAQVDYAVLVLDEHGNRLAELGNEDEPRVFGEAPMGGPGPGAGPSEGGGGIPKWVWIVGGVVVAGAVALGVGLALREKPITLQSGVSFE